MKTVIRYDKVNTASFSRTDEGYLVVDGIAVTPGLLRYRNADGSERIELIDAGEIKASMKTLQFKPVTLLHPSGMVGPKNIKALSVGTVGEVDIRADDALGVKFTIADAEAIAKADSGMRALSLGYTVQLDMTPGEHPVHGRYDAVQRGRRYNHLAIVPSGRSSGAGFRLDADDNLVPEGQMNVTKMIEAVRLDDHKKVMAALMDAGLSEEEAKKMADAVAKKGVKSEAKAEGETEEKEKAEQKADGSKKPKPEPEPKKRKAKKDADEYQSEIDVLQAKLDAAQSHDVLMAWHSSRVRLDGLAKSHKVDIAKLDNVEASKAILKAAGVDVEGKSADYVEARVDALSELKPNPYTGVRRTKVDAEQPKRIDPLDAYRTQFKESK